MAYTTEYRKPNPGVSSPPAAVASVQKAPDWAWGGRRLGDIAVRLACLAFYVLAMLLPLVGKAGAKVNWAWKNRITFLTALAMALALAAVASGTRLSQRKRQAETPFPVLPVGLTILGVLLFLAYSAGWMAL